jgi:hypothetical protein
MIVGYIYAWRLWYEKEIRVIVEWKWANVSSYRECVTSDRKDL